MNCCVNSYVESLLNKLELLTTQPIMKSLTTLTYALFAVMLFSACEKDYVAPNTSKPKPADPVEELPGEDEDIRNPQFKYMPYLVGTQVDYASDQHAFTNEFTDSVYFQGDYWLTFNNGANGAIDKIRSNGLYTYLITKVEGIETQLRLMVENPKVGDQWTNFIPREQDAIYMEKEVVAIESKAVFGENSFEQVAKVHVKYFYKNGSDLTLVEAYDEYFAPGYGLVKCKELTLKQIRY